MHIYICIVCTWPSGYVVWQQIIRLPHAVRDLWLFRTVVCVCVCVYIYIYIYIHTYIHTYIYTYMHTRSHMHTAPFQDPRGKRTRFAPAEMPFLRSIFIQLPYTHTHIHTYIHIYVHAYTLTHTYNTLSGSSREKNSICSCRNAFSLLNFHTISFNVSDFQDANSCRTTRRPCSCLNLCVRERECVCVYIYTYIYINVYIYINPHTCILT